MAKHAGARQAVVARNIANADTPGYQAQKLGAFSETYQSNARAGLRATRSGHIGDHSRSGQTALFTGTSEPAPNGNSVSIEEEMLNAVAIRREHDRALAIYRHTLTVLRTTIGR